MKFKIVCLVWVLLAFVLNSIIHADDLKLVEVIYLKPSDIKQEKLDIPKIHRVMKQVIDFYADNMEKLEHGRKTFDYDKNIRIVNGNRTLEEYSDSKLLLEKVFGPAFLIPPFTEFMDKVHIIFLAGSNKYDNGKGSSAIMIAQCSSPPPGFEPDNVAYYKNCRRVVIIPAESPDYLEVFTAHELGHSFGLRHDHATRRNHIMSKPLWHRNLESYNITIVWTV